jgi:outer membrane biogenesis lipoprotein LolB
MSTYLEEGARSAMNRRVGCLGVLAASLLVLSGCSGTTGGRPEITQGSFEQSQIELRVLETVTGPAEAAYNPDDRTVYLTIYVEDVDAVSDSELASLRDTALQAISGEGIAVVVELSEEDPPRTE